MPRREHVITVFVGSPADVGDERTKLEEVIRELNITWSRELRIRLDLVRWETHAFPGVGDDAQQVINDEVPVDYDLFVGVMWHRYGTPTGRSDSGTVEEYERARARYEVDQSSVKIMVYFKDEPVPPSRLDPYQLSKVNEFRDSLARAGTLYWTFDSVDQFEKLIRVHLTRQVQMWKAKLNESECGPDQIDLAEQPTQELETNSEDDLGFLDLVDIFEDRFAELTNIAQRIGTAIEDYSAKLKTRAIEMSKLPRDSQGNVNRKVAKRLISRAAADMGQFTARIGAELPLFRDAFNIGMSAFSRSVSISAEFFPNKVEGNKSQETLVAIVTLRETMTTSRESMNDFRKSVANLPSMTSELNRAKRAFISTTDKLISEFNNGIDLLEESELVVKNLQGDE